MFNSIFFCRWGKSHGKSSGGSGPGLDPMPTEMIGGALQPPVEVGNNFFGLAPPPVPSAAFLSLPNALPTPPIGALHYPSQDPSRMGAQMAQNHPPPQ